MTGVMVLMASRCRSRRGERTAPQARRCIDAAVIATFGAPWWFGIPSFRFEFGPFEIRQLQTSSRHGMSFPSRG